MRAWPAALAAAGALLLAGCGVDSFHFATPPDTTLPASTTTTAPPDFTGALEATVPGSSSSGPAVTIQGGKASLSGTVAGPSGPVGGASVEVERFVGDRSAGLRVTSAPNGAWAVPGIHGGRYRVRAWQTPTLALADPQVFFLGGTESRQVPLDLAPYNAQEVSTAANPLTAPVGEGINVAVSVQTQTVDSDGYVSYQPSPNVPVQLSSSGPVQVAATPLSTDGQGLATFTLACLGDGGVSATASTPTGTSQAAPGLSCYTLSAPPPTVPSPAPTTPPTTPGAPGSTTTTTPLPGPLPGLP